MSTPRYSEITTEDSFGEEVEIYTVLEDTEEGQGSA